MFNRDFFVQKVNEGAELRNELNTKHHKHLGKLALLFRYCFGTSEKTFKYINDMEYYLGGWPSINTPPKLYTLIRNVSTVFHYLTLAGRDERFNEYCKEWGIKITIEKPHPNIENKKFDDNFKFNKLLQKLYPDVDLKTKQEVINFLLDEGYVVQEEICKLADEIKIEKGEQVRRICNIKTNHYLNIVNIKASNLDDPKSLKVAKRINNVKKDVDQLTQAISIFPS